LIYPGGNAGVQLRSQSVDGFTAPDLPPGNYVAQVRARSASGIAEYANVPVSFKGEDLTISIVTGAAGAIVGRIVFDATPPSSLKPTDIQLAPVFLGGSVSPGRVEVRDDWTFRVDDIVGVGFLQVRSGSWFLKRVVVDGEDVTDKPLDFQSAFKDRTVEVRLTQLRATVSGSVYDPKGQTSTDYVVVAFAEDSARWTARSRFVATARPDQSGGFRLTGLPPGAYFICAVDRFERGREYDVQTLERLRRMAKRITLAEGESKIETLTVAPLR
jgi:hypothetical protein